MASSVWPQNKSKNSLFLIFVKQERSTSYTTILLVYSIQSDQTANILPASNYIFRKSEINNRLLIFSVLEIGICKTPNTTVTGDPKIKTFTNIEK